MQISFMIGRAKRALALIALGASALLVASCGGGGVSGSTGLSQGALQLLPGTGDLYAGVPFNFTIAGGRAPYFVTTDQQTLIPGPFTVNGNNFTVVPNNPGVVDVGQDPNQVPSRTINITVRDNAGTQISQSYSILQNFLTGYGFTVVSLSTCGVTGAEVSVAACAGFESRIDFRPTSAGVLRARRQIRFSINYGPFAYIQDDNQTLAATYTLTTDDLGRGTARLFAAANAFTQYASMRATDVATGAYVDFTFVLLSAPLGPLTAIPAALPTVTGGDTSSCGNGSSSIVVTGGAPPYTATSTAPLSVLVSPATVATSGGTFNVIYGGGLPPNCGSGQVVITDSLGQVITVSAASAPGTGAPVQPLSASPNPLCVAPLTGSGTILVSGGNPNKVVNTSNPAVAPIAPTSGTGNFNVSVGGGAGLMAGTATVTISDGASTRTVTVNRQATCP